MDYVSDLIQAFGTPAFVLAYVMFSVSKGKQVHDHLEIGSKKFEVLERNMMIVGRSSLRLEIVNENIPLIERARAYQHYAELFNGNGAIKEYYEKNIRPYLAEEFIHHDN